MIERRWVFGEDGRVRREEAPPPAPCEVKDLKAELLFVIDPERPTGTRKQWRLEEQCDGRLPTLGNIYLPKAFRKIRGKAAVPLKVRISLHVEYAQVEPLT